MITLEHVVKKYASAKNIHVVLDDLFFETVDKESVAISGRSGSGKTTLLNIITGIDGDFEGTYQFGEHYLSQASSRERSAFRLEKLGIITQQFDLLDDRVVFDNVALAIKHLKLSRNEQKERVGKMLEYVGLPNYERKRIKQLSGGEMQRVAIARALVKEPEIIIADEPTGSLDEQTRGEILSLFQKMMGDGTQFIIVTHDNEVANICDKVYLLENGKLKVSEVGQ